MAQKGTIGVKIKLDGADEYNRELKKIGQAEKELQSEMKKTQAQYKGTEDSQEALQKKYDQLAKKIELQNQRYEANKRMVDAAAKAQADAAAKAEQLRTKLEAQNAALEKSKASGEASAEAIKEQQDAISETTKELEKQEARYEKASDAMSEYTVRANNAETSLIGLNSELIDTSKKLMGVEEPVEDDAKALKEMGSAAQGSGSQIQTLGDIIKANLASQAIQAAAKALVNGIRDIAEAAVGVGSDFEASMSQVAATMGISTKEIEAGSSAYATLTAAAKQCGEDTMYSASQAAEALNYLALAGYDAEKAAETLPKVLNLAAAGGLELATASDMVTDAMAALGMETSELDNYIDEMATAAQKSNTSVAQLGEATLTVAGVATSAGMQLEDMNAALGVLANNGIKGAEGGTHLRNVLLSLSAPTVKASDALYELGIETEDADGNMRSLNDIMTDLNRALDGLGSAEKTRIINNIFNKTDIAAVNALLKGSNGEFQSLKDNLQNCAGAAKNMADTMNNNLKGKITILQSALEALGISTYEIFDDKLKGGVDEATAAVKRLNKSVKEGDMHTSLDKLAGSIGSLMEKLSALAENALPDVIDGAAWCIDHLDLIISLITGIVTANATMGTIVPVIEAAQAAWTAYKTANEGATVAQWAMNAAMSANPVGLLVTGVAALTGGLMAYSAINAATAEEVDRLTKEQREQVEAAKELTENVNNAREAYGKTLGEISASKTRTEELIGKLRDQRKWTELTTDEQREMKDAVAELNILMPELNLYLNEQTGELNKSIDTIEAYTEAIWRQAEAQAYQERMVEIVKERIEAERQLREIEEDYTAATEANNAAKHEMIAAEERLAAATSEYSDASMERQRQLAEEATAARENYLETAKANESLIDTYNGLRGVVTGLDREKADLDERIGQTGTYEAATAQVEALAEGTGNAAAAAGLMEDAYNELYDAVHDSIEGQMSLFDAYNKALPHTKEEILKNMSEQVSAMEDWAENMEELATKGIDQGLLEKLAAMGPEGAGYVAAFVEMSGDELREANALFEEAMMLPDETAKSVADTYEQSGYVTWQAYKKGFFDAADEDPINARERGEAMAADMANGTIERLEDAEDELANAGRGMFNSVEDAVRDAGDMHSPSRVMIRVGEDMLDGYIEGLTSPKRIAQIEKSARELAMSVRTRIEEELEQSKFEHIGVLIGEGLETGMRSRLENIRRAAQDMAQAAIDASTETLDIHSPSKVYEYLGEMSGEGYIEGLESSLSGLDEAVAMLVPEMPDLSGMAEISEEAYESLHDTVQKSVQGQIDIFKEYKASVAQSKDDVLKNMEDQVSGMAKWADDMTTLATRGIDEGLLEKLSAMGPDGAGYVAAFVDMTDEELQKANTLFEAAAVLPEYAANNIASTYQQTGYQSWMKFMYGSEQGAAAVAAQVNDEARYVAEMETAGYIEGMDAGAPEMTEASRLATESAIQAMRDAAEVHSPSEVTREIGQFIAQGLAEGIAEEEQIEGVIASAQVLTDAVKNAIKENLKRSEFYNIGQSIGEGLEEGLKSKIKDVERAARKLAAAAAAASREELDIHSPSRVFAQIGEMSGEGYIQGLEGSLGGLHGVMDSLLPQMEPRTETAAGLTVNQDINIYSAPEDISDMTRKFRIAQREAAEAW